MSPPDGLTEDLNETIIANDDHVVEPEPPSAEDIKTAVSKNPAIARVSRVPINLADEQPPHNKLSLSTEDYSPTGEFDLQLSPVDSQEIETLTNMDQFSALAMAEEYEINKPKIGPERRPGDSMKRQPAKVLRQARALFILEQESLEVDQNPNGLPRATRLAIESHDDDERSKIIRAYLHKYRFNYEILSNIHSKALDEKARLTQENELLKQNFDMLKEAYVETDSKKHTLHGELTDTRTHLEKIIEDHAAREEELNRFRNEELPAWEKVRKLYNKAAAHAKSEEIKAKHNEQLWKAYAESNRELADAERLRRENGGSEPATPVRGAVVEELDAGVRAREIERLKAELTKSDRENQRFRVLLTELKEHFDAQRSRKSGETSLHAQAETMPLNRFDDTPSPKTVYAPSQSAVDLPWAAVGHSLPLHWQLREAQLRESLSYRQNHDNLRRLKGC